mgnify:CR=1 FL=1
MIDMYFNQNIENILLIVNKKKSYDSRLKGDFGMNDNILNKKKNLYIYTGCQIIKKKIFNNFKKKKFFYFRNLEEKVRCKYFIWIWKYKKICASYWFGNL